MWTRWSGEQHVSTGMDAAPGIVAIAEAVRMARMHPAGPKRVKITLGGWSDYREFHNKVYD